MMDDKDLKNFFTQGTPAPDPERRKETLNLALAAFEARKSATLKNNVKSGQGLSWLSRLTSQNKPERKDDMTNTNKKWMYGGLAGGLATACIALLIYQGPVSNLALPVQVQSLEQAETGYAASGAVDGAAAPVPEQFAQADIAVAAPVPMGARREMNIASSQVAPETYTKLLKNLNESDPSVQSRAAAPAMGGAVATMEMAQGNSAGIAMDSYAPVMPYEGRDKFSNAPQNEIKQVKAEPVSTFSIDVDTASYAFVRQSLDNGVLPQKDAVRVEELINYFDYAYPLPTSKDKPFSTNVVVKDSPWNAGKKLMTIGIKGYDVEKTAQPDSNLVFLIDTSGSMNDVKKLPLLKQSFSMLLDTLKSTDTVSIVTYAGSAGVVLQPTKVSDKGDIMNALQNLAAGGSTAGGEGIRLAYQQAQANFKKDAVNRVILATDGDFNVGITDEGELKGFIEREREKGIFLSVIGFGTGNYNDAMMQTLAQNGNGVAAYIDTLNEARKVLVQEASSTLFPIAKDVKIQVEFNPAAVSEYRLVGYETRMLNTEDFNNDKVDAGDIGAGAEVTAIYEVTPVGGPTVIDQSRYAPEEKTPDADKDGELAFVKVRYKLPDEKTSKLITTPVMLTQKTTDETVLRETSWAEAVAGYGQLLKGGQYTGSLTYDDVLKTANANKGDDPFGQRSEFINLVYKAKTAASLPQTGGGGMPGYPGGMYE